MSDSPDETTLFEQQHSMSIVDVLRKTATGERELPTWAREFISKDWRPGSVPLLLWHAADEISRLRTLVGAADLGPSFREISKDFPRAPKAGEA